MSSGSTGGAGGHVFARATGLPTASHAGGAVVVDTDGREYLDGSGGAVVTSIGHGVGEVVDAIAAQARKVAYVHPTAMRSAEVDAYADELAPLLPVDDPRVYPVSGGSEAVETALKMARAFHLAQGRERHVVVARGGAYHGSTRGALDVSGRDGLRAPYLPWLGATRRATAPYEYRCPAPEHPVGCGTWHARRLDELLTDDVAAFVAEPVAGAGLGACVPDDEYWPAVARVCRERGVLLVADEVMTGFGRTGRWFACEHWGVRPDLLVAAKGASSGYWPLGLAVCSGRVREAIGAFTHGFTNSHHAVGAAAGRAVLRVLSERGLVAASERVGAVLDACLRERLGGHHAVGDVRGIGLLRGVELVADLATRAPFPRAERVAERVVAAARERGLLVYHSTGCADGRDGDVLLLGPPLVITEEQVAVVAERLALAVRDVLG
ncbi:aspartate aminotransferase family protein [Actinosynnema pretiosum subsp. pretiosum]|uniref:Aspartate aminotransferase family protein n=1 Tax=Actinosynnema pretiosum subsp. pretiosum TaxID=103721 RepID=A0AA45L9R7_9PSEU|nr:Adenosylmethionine-8-amino-7-oxononanoate aminotransferase [Actinosynnema pretiosum subsp. pretiosum]QUF05383.1 aspartate aminotransferase family protein [Actinosynnema pretiosum subsp. pretiosum]